MKGLLKQLIFLSITLLFYTNSIAQISSIKNSVTINNELNIPPLQTVIDSVLKKNAMVRFRKQGIVVKEAFLKEERQNWTTNFGVMADGEYGTYDSFSSSIEGGGSNTLLTTRNNQFNYSFGLYLKMPVFDLLNRKNQIKRAKAEIEEAESMADFQIDEVRQTVITLYQNLILKHKILLIKSQSLGHAKLNMEMVEKEFRNGVATVTEYTRISGISSSIETEYEVAKAEFILTKTLLEDMAGFKFDILTSN